MGLPWRGDRDPMAVPGVGGPIRPYWWEGGCWGVLGGLDAAGCCWQGGSWPVVVPLEDCGGMVAAWSPVAWPPSCWEGGGLSSPPRKRRGSLSLPSIRCSAGGSLQPMEQPALPRPVQRFRQPCRTAAGEGDPPVSWPCSGEGRVAPGRTAALPPDCWHSSRTSLARCGRPHAAPSSCSAASPSPSRLGGRWHRSGDLSRAGGRPPPRGIAHRVWQPPAVSRPFHQTPSVPCVPGPLPLLGGRMGSPTRPLSPSLSSWLAAGPVPYKVRCRVPAWSPQVTPLSEGGFPSGATWPLSLAWGQQARWARRPSCCWSDQLGTAGAGQRLPSR